MPRRISGASEVRRRGPSVLPFVSPQQMPAVFSYPEVKWAMGLGDHPATYALCHSPGEGLLQPMASFDSTPWSSAKMSKSTGVSKNDSEYWAGFEANH